MTGISVWYCCLNPDERGCLQFCSDAFISTLSVGFPRALYDAYWLTVAQSRQARANAFAHIYKLRFGEFVPNPETPPVEWVFFDDLPLWVEMSLFVVSPASLCLGGCQLPSYLAPVT